MVIIMRIFVGCSANENISEDYIKDCTELLEEVLKDNDLVFGAWNHGLMKVSYDIAKKNNRKVTGMCPEIYKESFNEIECDKQLVTTSIKDSTMKIFENSDLILFLPGGFGTLYEIISANYCKICKEIDLPIVIYNSNGYYTKLLDFINDCIEEKFIPEHELGKYFVASTKEEVISFIKKYQ